jgi:hypothetical protein
MVGTIGTVCMYALFHTANNEGPEVAAIEGSGETKGPESMLTGRSLFETEAKMLKC